MRPHLREIEGVLSLYGIKPEIQITNGNHVRVRWRVGDRVQKLVMAATPSDHRAAKNEVAKVRRLLRQAGVTKIAPLADDAAPPPSSPPAIAAQPPLPIEQRVAQLEHDVRTLLELLTDPERKQRMLAPPPEPPPLQPCCIAEPPKQRALHWVFRALRYDEFMPVQHVAKAAGKSPGTTAVALSVFKKQGLVEHRGKGQGWRKHRDVELLMNGHGATH